MTRIFTHDVVVVGGGLAGIHAASKAASTGASVAMIDCGIPGSSSKIGGFAPFSGAKFSLFPAGTGLSPIVGGDEQLCRIYENLLVYLARSGLRQFTDALGKVAGEQTSDPEGLNFRRYHSVLLSPEEVGKLLAFLEQELGRSVVIADTVASLDLNAGGPFELTLASGNVVRCARLIHAAGRLGSDLLKQAGVPESKGKGLDIGVRLEFDSLAPLAGLRRQGPDAKFMHNGVRTFCLNSPGEIFHYSGLGFRLPGGVVAGREGLRSNVALLYRLQDRTTALSSIEACRTELTSVEEPMSFRSVGNFNWDLPSRALLPGLVIEGLTDFAERLDNADLVDRSCAYTTHYPLLDWHWPVFSLPGTLETAMPGVFAAGDTSGHARGLLQAAAMGWIAADEALR